MKNAADWLEWLVRASLPVVAVALVGMYAQSERQLVIIQMHTKEIAELKADLSSVKTLYATKMVSFSHLITEKLTTTS